jgi:hypothetical protein
LPVLKFEVYFDGLHLSFDHDFSYKI